MTPVSSKVCTGCGVDKPFLEFYKNKVGRFGLYSKCKPCHNEVVRKSSARPEAVSDRRVRLASQREHINARQRAYWASHPELKDYHAGWMKDHPEIWTAANHRRRIRLMSAEGSFTSVEWEDLCDQYGGLCLRCGERKKLTVDHVIPISKGGLNVIENIQPLCGPCNSSKGVNSTDYRCVPF